ncbi:hypothetical protein SAMN05444422_106266 [Halobiforma haloterrestris]|uniref:Uncharacterized protein n=1 Tax=Natronobacterium haloterrestre TaxID=148448 RepID=A0A1I1I0P1_NATHA|nr:hypothetical protein SAMN05444422_106266 [Halobiforma haloterrestris]
MNPTTRPQPPELSLSAAFLWVSTTGKNWRLDWGPPGRRRPPHRSREGVSEAVATRQAKSDPRPLVPAHRGTKGRQADGTARARTQGNLRLGASPPSLRDERDARCKRIPRPNGRRTRHTPRGADVSRTNPVSLAGPRSAGEKLPAGTRDWPAVPRWNPRASARGGCQCLADAAGNDSATEHRFDDHAESCSVRPSTREVVEPSTPGRPVTVRATTGASRARGGYEPKCGSRSSTDPATSSAA